MGDPGPDTTEAAKAVSKALASLTLATEAAGITRPNPWSALYNVFAGPVPPSPQSLEAVGAVTMAKLRTAYAEGVVEANVINRLLDLVDVVLPIALTALA